MLYRGDGGGRLHLKSVINHVPITVLTESDVPEDRNTDIGCEHYILNSFDLARTCVQRSALKCVQRKRSG